MNFDPQPTLREARDHMLLRDEAVLWDGAPDPRSIGAHVIGARVAAGVAVVVAVGAAGFIVLMLGVIGPQIRPVGGGPPQTMSVVFQTCGGLVGLLVAGFALVFARMFWRIGEHAKHLPEHVLYTLTDRRVIIHTRNHKGAIETAAYDADAIEGFSTRAGISGTTDLVLNGLHENTPASGGTSHAREVAFQGLGDAIEPSEVLSVVIDSLRRQR